jgi:hypothetical protein
MVSATIDALAAAHLPPIDHAAAQLLIELARCIDEQRPGDDASLRSFENLCESLDITVPMGGCGDAP